MINFVQDSIFGGSPPPTTIGSSAVEKQEREELADTSGQDKLAAGDRPVVDKSEYFGQPIYSISSCWYTAHSSRGERTSKIRKPKRMKSL